LTFSLVRENQTKEKTMTRDQLIQLVSGAHKDQEAHYMAHGPDKHEQEDHYGTGVSVVDMNVGLLSDWLADSGQTDEEGQDALDSYDKLPKADRRAVWEASGFHFGIMGYEQHDADFYWQHEQPD
jgi:hypothetical protein